MSVTNCRPTSQKTVVYHAVCLGVVNHAGLGEEEIRVSCNISPVFSRRNARNTPNNP